MNLFIKQISAGLSTSCTPGLTTLVGVLIKTLLNGLWGETNYHKRKGVSDNFPYVPITLLVRKDKVINPELNFIKIFLLI